MGVAPVPEERLRSGVARIYDQGGLQCRDVVKPRGEVPGPVRSPCSRASGGRSCGITQPFQHDRRVIVSQQRARGLTQWPVEVGDVGLLEECGSVLELTGPSVLQPDIEQGL